MELYYLETAQPGLRWMRAYFRQNPQFDRKKAVKSLKLAEQTLIEFPQSGEVYEDFETVREYKISNTAFSLLYTVARETIWIIDVRDQRGLRSSEALAAFTKELRQKHGLN